MRVHLFTLWILILNSAPALSNDFGGNLDLLFVKELPQVQVLALLQDSHGYLWVGSESGLYRFDGYNIKQYPHDPKDPETISDDWINCLLEDDKGFIWVGTENGLNIYSYLSERCKPVKADSAIPLRTATITCIAQNKDAIWVGTEQNGLFRIVPDKHKNELNEPMVYHIDHFSNSINDKNSLPDQAVHSICFDKYGRGWIGTNLGLSFFNASEHRPIFVTIHHTLNKNSIASNEIGSISYDSVYNSIWVTSIGMVDRIHIPSSNIDTAKLVAIHFSNAIKNMTGVINSQFGSFIIGTDETYWLSILGYGLIKFKYEAYETNGVIKNYQAYKTASIYFYKIYKYPSSYLTWFGSSDGVWKLVTEPQVFQQLTNFKFLTKGYLSCIYKDASRNIWLGTIRNKVVLISSNGLIKYFDLPEESAQNGVNNIVFSITSDSTGDVLIGSIYGLYLLEAKSIQQITSPSFSTITNPFKHVSFGSTIQNHAVFCFAIDSSRGVWVGTMAGLYYYQSESRTLIAAPGLPGDLPISAIAVQDQERIWIATQKGLHLYNPHTLHDSLFTTDNSSKYGFKSNEVHALAFNKKSNQLWIGTDNGIFLHSDSSQEFKDFMPSNQFVSGQVSSIICDVNNITWFATMDGLVMYNPGGNRIKYFNEWYAPFNRGISDYVLCEDPFGDIILSNQNGVFSINKELMLTRSVTQQVIITDLKIKGSTIFPSSIGTDFRLKDSITLDPGQGDLSVEFITPNFINPEKVKYAYRFGNDTSWNYIGNAHFVPCPILGSGSFKFSVKATNEDGDWNETPTTFSVYVKPPFYKTGFFYALIAAGCVLLIGLILYTFYRIRLQRILFAQRIRNKIASDLHDDIGSTMNSISLYSEIARQRAEREFPPAIPYFEKIGEDSRSIIGNMSDIVWMINPKNDSMETLLMRMENFANQLLGPKNISFHFNYSEKVKKIKPPMEARRNLFLIFKEALNNSVKYSACSNIKINLLEHHGRLHLFISDDGKGFNVNGNYTGNGLHNFGMRAKEIGGTIDIKSEPNKGTTIHLEFKST